MSVKLQFKIDFGLLVFISTGNFTRIAVQNLQPNMYRVLGENVRSAIRPFHQAKAATVQHIFHARPYSLFLILQPEKVDMKDPPAGIAVFVNNRKGRAPYSIGDALFYT
jgi:hypothetical protein